MYSIRVSNRHQTSQGGRRFSGSFRNCLQLLFVHLTPFKRKRGFTLPTLGKAASCAVSGVTKRGFKRPKVG